MVQTSFDYYYYYDISTGYVASFYDKHALDINTCHHIIIIMTNCLRKRGILFLRLAAERLQNFSLLFPHVARTTLRFNMSDEELTTPIQFT